MAAVTRTALALVLSISIDADLQFFLVTLSVATIKNARRLIDTKDSTESSSEYDLMIFVVFNNFLYSRGLLLGG